jgi:glutaredoxin
MSLIIYTKPNCPNCEILKTRLNSKNVEFEVIELNFGQETQNQLMEVIDFKSKFPGITSMPFFELKIHDEVITGGITKALNLLT